MQVLTQDETRAVSGGTGLFRNGILQFDSSQTREGGQNSYGESTPGGAEFYFNAMATADLQRRTDEAQLNQVTSCTTGNLLVCVINTFQVLHGQLEQAGNARNR